MVKSRTQAGLDGCMLPYVAYKRSALQGGVHVQDRGNEALPPDLVKLLKTQDIKYLQTQRAMEQKVSGYEQCI